MTVCAVGVVVPDTEESLSSCTEDGLETAGRSESFGMVSARGVGGTDTSFRRLLNQAGGGCRLANSLLIR